MDAEAPAYAEEKRRAGGRAGAPWTQVGDAATRVLAGGARNDQAGVRDV
jgi:hypothetical protein